MLAKGSRADIRPSGSKGVKSENISRHLWVEEALITKEFREALLREIKALGEPDSTILLRKYYFSESSREIAAALNLTVSSVDTRTHRAIQKLRSIFGGERV